MRYCVWLLIFEERMHVKLISAEKPFEIRKNSKQAKYLTLSELHNYLEELRDEEFILTVPLKMDGDDNGDNTRC